jgi:uncharacterized protein (TIGR02421 family)
MPNEPAGAAPGARVVRPAPEELPDAQRVLRVLSDRIVEAQRPIRILDAVKWDEEVERQFFADGAARLPRVSRDYYANRPLGFDLAAKQEEFAAIERDVRRELGTLSTAGGLMLKTCKEYRTVLELLAARGTPEFSRIAQSLYGSTLDRFHLGEPTLGDLARTMLAILERLQQAQAFPDEELAYDADAAVAWLHRRLDAYFGAGRVRVLLSDGVIADAAAGADYIKIRREARFSARDLGVIEVHEGWVHVGTTLNGLEQPVLTFLGKGTPTATVTQEGLAIIQEIFSFRSSPRRILRLTGRVDAIRMAEEGGDFLEVYRALVERGATPEAAYQTAQRAFRGSLPELGPFTKDLSYSRGFILIYNFIRLAVREGLVARIPLLFLGKVRLGDLGALHQLLDEGLLVPPHFLPVPYTDLNGLAAWMCYSNFLNTIRLARAADDYAALLSSRAVDL